MQNDINKLLSEKFSKIINDSTSLRLLRVVDQLLSLLFVEKSNIWQKLIKINKKFKRIENNTIKTKTNVESYATAIKAESWSKANAMIVKRQIATKRTNSKKPLHEIRKKKQWWSKSTMWSRRRYFAQWLSKIWCKSW
jgi:hypothetical protein